MALSSIKAGDVYVSGSGRRVRVIEFARHRVTGQRVVVYVGLEGGGGWQVVSESVFAACYENEPTPPGDGADSLE